jgi:hypothetical protein
VPGFLLKLTDPRDDRYCTPTAGDHEKPKTPCAHDDSQDNLPRQNPMETKIKNDHKQYQLFKTII